jgi:hypothetical protein
LINNNNEIYKAGHGSQEDDNILSSERSDRINTPNPQL